MIFYYSRFGTLFCNQVMDNKSLNRIKDQNLFLKLGVKGTNETKLHINLNYQLKRK